MYTNAEEIDVDREEREKKKGSVLKNDIDFVGHFICEIYWGVGVN